MAERKLPDGWRVEWTQDRGSDKIRKYSGKSQPTNNTIGKSHTVGVSYTYPNGDKTYRQVHGAVDWDSLSDLIEYEIYAASPV